MMFKYSKFNSLSFHNLQYYLGFGSLNLQWYFIHSLKKKKKKSLMVFHGYMDTTICIKIPPIRDYGSLVYSFHDYLLII